LQDLNRQNFLKRLASLFAPQALKDLLGLQLKLRLQLLDASMEDEDKFMQGLQGIQWSEQITNLQTCLNAPNDSGKPLDDLLKSLQYLTKRFSHPPSDHFEDLNKIQETTSDPNMMAAATPVFHVYVT